MMDQHGNESEVSGYVRAEGRKLVNGEGRELLLRGVGFGNWLLPEGYMWKFPKEGDRPRRMERMVENLIGPGKAALFWELYYDRYITEEDIIRIAAEGFNSVRVPINARFLMKEGMLPLQVKEHRLAYIDRLIAWCREHRLYVILDLHGAPGGQTGTNIDDSERDQPELFTDDKNKQLTVELWRMLAARYKDEWIVAGYDLLNEPLPDWFAEYNHHMMPLYKEIIQAIREVDQRHMIILEGVHWATDWSIFTEKLDSNLMLQFHKYWSTPDTESLRPFLDKRVEWDVPIFMGEGGENNNDWYAQAFQLFEDHSISWNFWPWKKLDTKNSPCSIPMPVDWNLLVRYLEGGERPDTDSAERILWEFLDHLPLGQCAYHEEVIRALFRKAKS
jgi:endoglucanase